MCLNFFSTDGIPKRLDNPEVLRCLSSICLEATDGRLKVFVGLNANISCLEGPGCWSSTTRKDAGCDDANDDLCDFCNHCWRLWCCCLTCLHSRCRNLLSIWNREDVFTPCSGLCGNLLSIWNREDVFMPCGGLCDFWKLQSCNMSLLSCCDLCLAFSAVNCIPLRSFTTSRCSILE